MLLHRILLEQTQGHFITAFLERCLFLLLNLYRCKFPRTTLNPTLLMNCFLKFTVNQI
jgi:hypothetical protein